MASLLVALELGGIDLVLGDLGGEGAAGDAGDGRRTADVPPRLAQRLAEVALLEGGDHLFQLLRQRPRQIDGERRLAGRPAGQVGGQVLRPDEFVARRNAGQRSMAFSNSRMFPGQS